MTCETEKEGITGMIMNSTITELMERKSVRAFTDREISNEAREMILQAAMAAPTAGNQQLYTILDIRKQELKEQMADLCDHQPFIAKGKLVLIFCADFCKWYDVFSEADADPRKPQVGDLMLAVEDSCIAAQNAVVAAQSMGIGSCYIGDIMENCEKVRETLKLPQYVFPCAMLVFGYPTKQQQERPKPVRCKLEDIVCTDGYSRKTGRQLQEMFSKECTNRTFTEWAQAFCSRKYNSDFSKEMSRSVAEYLKDFQ